MAKKFKFSFERGGELVADACEKEAPKCVEIFEKLCNRNKNGYTFVVYHCCSAAHELTSDDVPLYEEDVVPEENVCHFGEIGDVTTVSANQSNELVGLAKAGYSTICWTYQLPQQFMGTSYQTNRASVFAKIRNDATLLREIGHRIHIHGEERCTMTCYEEE